MLVHMASKFSFFRWRKQKNVTSFVFPSSDFRNELFTAGFISFSSPPSLGLL